MIPFDPMPKHLLIFVFLFIMNCGFSQQLEQDGLSEYPKNTTYISLGVLFLGGHVNANYERLVYAGKEKIQVSYYAKAYVGRYAARGVYGYISSLNAQAVFGNRGNGHLEIGLGAAMVLDELKYQDAIEESGAPETSREEIQTRLKHSTFFFSRSIGFRRQKPDGGFVFRTGIGVPDGVYISFGVAF